MTKEPSHSTEGTFFTLQPVPPPQPQARTHWSLPLALGVLAIPLLMIGFGLVQQQNPVPASSASPLATPAVETSPTPTTPPIPAAPQLNFLPPPDSATLPTAIIHCPGVAANFRAAPSLHSQVLGVLQDGDLVEVTTEQRVQQDGVMWVPVRFRGRIGWLASNFIGRQTYGQP